MADILSRQYLGRPVTDFQWIKDHYGPNARELPEATDQLAEQGLAEETMSRDGERRTIRLRALPTPALFGFTLGENEVLRYVVENYADMPIEEFIEDVVKETDPVKAVERQGDALPMEIVDGTMARVIGFDLERVLNAERQAAEGLAITLADFVNELRTELTAGYTK